ncbi:MAG TPA: DUF4349 domain-containing protein [Anaerolineae bacterium]|nr:DUF4349 domain-containing protein [Anaerolineae bacterium]HIQ12505.1 DUF4349 domain-containing protein [Caldilineales bacterium]
MKRWIAIAILLLIALAVGACGSASAPPTESRAIPQGITTQVVERPAEMPRAAEVLSAEESDGTGGASSLAPLTADSLTDVRKIIYQGNMVLFVEDTEQAAREIQAMAESAGGYVAQMRGYRQGDRVIYDITIRVPAEKFENARNALRELAVRVDSESVITEDVTDQYYDIEARLKTLKETEAELTELLRETRERGGDVDEIMKIYDRLTRIRADIESLQGQLNRLDKLVAFSTLDIHLEPHILAEPIKPQDEWSFAEIVHSSINTLVDILAGLATLAIRFVIIVAPVALVLLLPLGLLLWGLKRWQRWRQQRHED